MKNRGRLLLIPILSASTLMAADSDTHLIQVEVASINELSLSGGNVTLTIDSATAGEQPDPATDSSTVLTWTTNQLNRKLTIDSDLPITDGTLQAEASVTSGGGNGEGLVTITALPRDFITGFGGETGTATVTYTATSSAEDRPDDSTYSISYTLTAQ